MATYAYDDFRVTVTPRAVGDDDYETRVVDATGDEHVGVFRSPFDGAEFEQAVLRLARGNTRKASLGAVAPDARATPTPGTTRDVGGNEPPELDAERVGAALAAALFSGEIGVQYQAAGRRAAAAGRGLRLTLSLAAAPGLLSVPWEFLYVRPRFLANQRRSPLVRHLATDTVPAPPSIEATVKVLGVVASPRELPSLDVAGERARVERAVAKVVALGRVELDWLEPATPRRLRETLRDGNYDILHYVGHSDFSPDGEGVLFLEGGDGRPTPVDGTELANLLSDQARLRLVVLNSCEGARTTLTDPYAGVATTLVQLGVPAVVAMQFEISDEAAILFAEELYTNLIARQSPIDAAVAEGRKAIYIEMRNLEWATPVLFMSNTDIELFHFELPAAPLPPPPPPEATLPLAGSTDAIDAVGGQLTGPGEAAARSTSTSSVMTAQRWWLGRRALWGAVAATIVAAGAYGVFAWVDRGDSNSQPLLRIAPEAGPPGATIEVDGDECPPAPDDAINSGITYWLDTVGSTLSSDDFDGDVDGPWIGNLVVPTESAPDAEYWVGASCWATNGQGGSANFFEYPTVSFDLVEP